MHARPTFLNPRSTARIVLWARAMLSWLALVLFGTPMCISPRLIRQRQAYFSLDWAARLVRALAIVRAVEIAALPPRRGSPAYDGAPPGFARPVARGATLRAIAGSRFRRALKHRDPAQRLQCLLAALGDIDALARRYLVPRGRRGLARLRPVLMRAPPSTAPLPRPLRAPPTLRKPSTASSAA